MKWLNPFTWYVAMKAYAKAHAVAFWISGAQTWALGAFPLSLAYPEWARAFVSEAWPVVKDVSGSLWDVGREAVEAILHTS